VRAAVAIAIAIERATAIETTSGVGCGGSAREGCQYAAEFSFLQAGQLPNDLQEKTTQSKRIL
jgi:hypothetical protein